MNALSVMKQLLIGEHEMMARSMEDITARSTVNTKRNEPLLAPAPTLVLRSHAQISHPPTLTLTFNSCTPTIPARW